VSSAATFATGAAEREVRDQMTGQLRRQTVLLILIPLLATFVGQRLYLHLINPNADCFIAGYNIHHLFTGALIEIPAAMILALEVGGLWTRRIACVASGAGCAMVFDEVVFLIATDDSNAAYLTPISLWGAVVLITVTVAVLFAVYLLTPRGE
jgi:hypothetical protein